MLILLLLLIELSGLLNLNIFCNFGGIFFMKRFLSLIHLLMFVLQSSSVMMAVKHPSYDDIEVRDEDVYHVSDDSDRKVACASKSGLAEVVRHREESAEGRAAYGLKIRIFPFDKEIPVSEEALYEYAHENGLGECHDRSCLLNRSGSYHAARNPQVTFSRSLFENYVVEQIKKMRNPYQTLVITSFGSGNLMQDLIFLWKLFHCGFKNFVFNFIDSEYEWEMQRLLADVHMHNRRNGIAVMHPIFDEKKLTMNWLVQAAKAFGFKGLNVQTFFFDSAEKYQRSCILNPALKSDFIISVDSLLGPSQKDSLIGPFVEVLQSSTVEDAAFFILCSPKYRLWPFIFSGHKTAGRFTLESQIDEFILTPGAGSFKEGVDPIFEQNPERPTTTFSNLQKAFDEA